MTIFEPQATQNRSEGQESTLESYEALGQSPQEGDKIITLELGSAEGMIAYGAQQRLIANRQTSAEGTILGMVPGYGGDVWYVDHQSESKDPSETQAVYTILEIAPKA